MTDLEKLRLQRDAINEKIAAAEQRELADSLRASFARLADESTPVCEIMVKVLGGRRTFPPSELPKFAERLAETVKAYADK
ncbi:MAG: hypothetical protein F4Y41_16145 [Gammaproteobacteria bacterium]|nr:hypothetical protein [Gammaproteobacteria bacterium]MYF29423.1 hypothetical protein [Gammaproteobacteria bacterium]